MQPTLSLSQPASSFSNAANSQPSSSTSTSSATRAMTHSSKSGNSTSGSNDSGGDNIVKSNAKSDITKERSVPSGPESTKGGNGKRKSHREKTISASSSSTAGSTAAAPNSASTPTAFIGPTLTSPVPTVPSPLSLSSSLSSSRTESRVSQPSSNVSKKQQSFVVFLDKKDSDSITNALDGITFGFDLNDIDHSAPPLQSQADSTLPPGLSFLAPDAPTTKLHAPIDNRAETTTKDSQDIGDNGDLPTLSSHSRDHAEAVSPSTVSPSASVSRQMPSEKSTPSPSNHVGDEMSLLAKDEQNISVQPNLVVPAADKSNSSHPSHAEPRKTQSPPKQSPNDDRPTASPHLPSSISPAQPPSKTLASTIKKEPQPLSNAARDRPAAEKSTANQKHLRSQQPSSSDALIQQTDLHCSPRSNGQQPQQHPSSSRNFENARPNSSGDAFASSERPSDRNRWRNNDSSSYQHRQNDGRNYRDPRHPLGFEEAADAFHAVNAENHPGKGFATASNAPSRNLQHPQQQHQHHPPSPSPGLNASWKRNDAYAKGNNVNKMSALSSSNGDLIRGSFNMNQCIQFMKIEWTKVLNMIEGDSKAVIWYETEERPSTTTTDAVRSDSEPAHDQS